LFLVVCGVLPLRALITSDGHFASAEWASVTGAVTVAAALALELWKWSRRRPDTSPAALEAIVTQLVPELLETEGIQRARLLGAGQLDTAYINVQYYRDMVRYRTAGGGRGGDLAMICDYYRRLDAGRLVVVGPPGSGKTVLALHFLVSLLEERRAGDPVPLRLSLTGVNPDHELTDWLVHELVSRFSHLSPVVAEALVRQRRILPVLDGLDEMDTDDEPTKRAAAAVRRINDYLSGTHRDPVVVTCRRDRYEMLLRECATVCDAATVEIQPLNAKQIADYLRIQATDARREAAWSPLLGRLAVDPDGRTTTALTSVLDTPWRLNLAVTALRDGMNPTILLLSGTDAEMAGYAERVRAELLCRYIPATSRLHPRPSGKHYDPSKVERWLRVVAGHLAWQQRNNLPADDVVLHRWWRIGGDRRVRLLHATFNLAILYAAQVLLLLGAVGPPATWVDGIIRLDVPSALDGPLLVGILVVMVIGPTWLAVWAPLKGRTLLYLLDLRTQASRRRLLTALAAGLAAGTAVGLAAGVAVAPVAGLMVVLMVGLPFRPAGHTLRRGSVIGSTVLGLTTALAAGLALGFAAGPTIGVATGLLIALAGTADGIRYEIGVDLTALGGRLPWPFRVFLDWAHAAGLMRRSGIAYQFRHRELQNWLTRTTSLPVPAPRSAADLAVNRDRTG